jgi:hypothetical protein
MARSNALWHKVVAHEYPCKGNWQINMKMLGAFLGLTVFVAPGPALAAIRNVDCSKGETITMALNDAVPGDTIRVTGTCRERITITTDRLTLDGQGRATLDGGGGTPTELSGLVTIDGARGVTITGVTIQNGPGDGILAIHAATFSVTNSTMQGHGFMGINARITRPRSSPT